MGAFLHNLRYGLRALGKNPGFTAIAVLTLALGIGANTAIFSLVSAALFRAMPYPHAERLAYLWQNNRRTPEIEGRVSYPNYADWRAQSRTIEDMAFFTTGTTMFGQNGDPEQIRAALVSTNFFSVMGVNPLLGRGFEPDDQIPSHAEIAVIGYSLWQTRFGSDPHVIGRSVPFGEVNQQIVGIMPSRFSFPEEAQIWIPREVFEFTKTKSRQYKNMEAIGRLRPGATWPQAQAEMDTIAKRLEAEYPEPDAGMQVRIVPLRDQLSHEVRHGLLLLWGAISGVLLIACLNVANLIVSRAAGREKEMAIRFSLGASRAQIARQFLAESFLLSIGGAVCGFLLAIWAVTFVSRMNPALAKLHGSALDGRVLGYTLASTAMTALLCGLLPVLTVSRLDLSRCLKEAGTGGAAPRAQKIRKALIVAEIACTFILLVGAGLLVRSLLDIFAVNPGFDAAHLLQFYVAWPHAPATAQEDQRRSALYSELMARLRTLPGVIAVGSTSNVLFPSDMYKESFVIEDRAELSGPSPHLTGSDASPDLFRALGVPLLQGRIFEDAETVEKAPPVAVINETMARYWPNHDALGKRFRLNDPNYKQPWVTIVGIVGDVRDEGLENPPGPTAYLPSSSYWADNLVIRTTGNPELLIPAVREKARALSKDLIVDDLQPVNVKLVRHEKQRQFNAMLLGAFSFIALVLAGVGIYGGLAYWVRQRTQEIGVRMALGAQERNIFALVMGRGMSLALLGLGMGIAGAVSLAHVAASFLFGVSATDPVTFAAVAILLTLVSFGACYIPARRAMRVDPILALRHE